MLQSQLFLRIIKEISKEIEAESCKLLLRGGFIHQLTTGAYSFLPLGWRCHQKIENIIREEMNAISGQEVSLPAMTPKELWQKTNRWNFMDPPLFKIRDRRGNEFALASTHEEVITKLAKSYIGSYKDLPAALYQIQNKFRNEMRFTGGLLRTREFIMKDLYSFHRDEKDLSRYFNKVVRAYQKIFRRCGLQAIKSEASGAGFTEKRMKTYEFQVKAEVGEDRVIFCPKCNFAANTEVTKLKAGDKCPKCKEALERINAIEVGHVFTLGTKYSQALDLYFIDERGNKKLPVMGCYGIGLGRLMATIVEVHHDKKGIIWPEEVAPFDLHLIPIFLGKEKIDQKIEKTTEKVYLTLQKRGFDVLYDDRKEKSPGEKFVDNDLVGIPKRIVVSERTLEKECVEVKRREEKEGKFIKITKIRSCNL